MEIGPLVQAKLNELTEDGPVPGEEILAAVGIPPAELVAAGRLRRVPMTDPPVYTAENPL